MHSSVVDTLCIKKDPCTILVRILVSKSKKGSALDIGELQLIRIDGSGISDP